MRRRRITFAIALLGGSALGFGVVAACSFPDVTFVPDDSVEAGDATTSSESSTGDAATDGGGRPTNPDVDPEGGSKDATTFDGSGRIDAGPDASCCDCDNDQVAADGGACVAASGDCDDLNPYIKPSQGFVASATWDSTHIPTYDWDCSGSTVKQYTHSLGSCAARSKLSGCANGQGGFEGDPQCGQSAHYVITCAGDGNALNLKCTETASDNRVQGCH